MRGMLAEVVSGTTSKTQGPNKRSSGAGSTLRNTGKFKGSNTDK